MNKNKDQQKYFSYLTILFKLKYTGFVRLIKKSLKRSIR